MPRYTPEEERNMGVVDRLFDTTNPEDKSLLFTEDAVWWNGLPFVGEGGETEHKGRAAIHGILTGATSGPSEKKTNRGVDAYGVSTIRIDSTPFSRRRAEVSRAEKPPPMNSTSTSSLIGSRSMCSSTYGSVS